MKLENCLQSKAKAKEKYKKTKQSVTCLEAELHSLEETWSRISQELEQKQRILEFSKTQQEKEVAK